jgi:methylaspartate ammonia-lyase
MLKIASLRVSFVLSLSFHLIGKFNTMAFSTGKSRDLVMDAFAIRQFNNPHYTGTQVSFDVQNFEDRINEYYENGMSLVDGYGNFILSSFSDIIIFTT